MTFSYALQNPCGTIGDPWYKSMWDLGTLGLNPFETRTRLVYIHVKLGNPWPKSKCNYGFLGLQPCETRGSLGLNPCDTRELLAHIHVKLCLDLKMKYCWCLGSYHHSMINGMCSILSLTFIYHCTAVPPLPPFFFPYILVLSVPQILISIYLSTVCTPNSCFHLC